jgi:hypothetical protein
VRAVLLLLAFAACKEKEPPPPVPPPAPIALPQSPIDTAAKAETIEGWDKAAAELEATVANCTTWTGECAEAARDAVQARGRALGLEHLTDPRAPLVPVELPTRALALIAACDTYVKRSPASDPDAPQIALIAAEQEWRYGWADRAVPRYEALLRGDRTTDAAALAIPRLLEGLRRQGRAADIHRWVTELLADDKLMTARPALRELLEGLSRL